MPHDRIVPVEVADVTDGRPDATIPRLRRLAFPAVLLLIWLVCSALYCAFRWQDITHFVLRDPDDAMRLLEGRDWMAGQSWFDVSQYRLDPPHGFAMHWSRLLDVPLAAVILLVRPFYGQHVAEAAACVAVPMLTLGCTMILVAAITRRFVGPLPGLLAAAFCTLNLGTFYAIRPMRIDHHGWQIVAGLGIVLALMGKRSHAKTAAAAFCAALWMHISLEGIMFTVATAGWLGACWLAMPDREGPRLPVFLAGLTASSLMLFLVAHGGALFDRTFCDAVSPVHMAAFAIAAFGTFLAVRHAPHTLIGRLGALGATAVACAALYRLSAPECSAGAFNLMTPLVRQLWYLHVYEGLPLWQHSQGEFFAWLLFPLIGFTGGILVALKSADAGRRTDALMLSTLLAAATLIGVMVMRAGAFSNLLAIPGAMILLATGMRRLERVRFMPARVIGMTLLPLLLTPVTPAMAFLANASKDKSDDHVASILSCEAQENVAKLNALQGTTIFTPLDIAPSILVGSHQSAVGAGYHRNADTLDDVLRFFTTAPEAEARAIAKAHHATLLAFCPSSGDMQFFPTYAPYGLAAQLAASHPPAWLRPIQVPGLRLMKVYAILD